MNGNILSLSTKTSTEEIRYEFTEEDIREIEHDLSQQTIKIDNLEQELKDLQDPLKQEIKNRKNTIKKMLSSLRNGFEWKDMEVHHVPDYESNMMEFYCVQTGQKVYARTMTREERQLDLKFNNQTEEH